jgi:NAD+--asparagine ADP-ribosyltransferase
VDAHKGSQEVYSKKVKAGKRTYFFDVKATRAKDYYLTITESKKQYSEDGNRYEKHKIFLYKEDLNKFLEALYQTTEHIKKELLPDYDFDKFDENRGEEEMLMSARGEAE